jgi:hypothetical protein
MSHILLPGDFFKAGDIGIRPDVYDHVTPGIPIFIPGLGYCGNSGPQASRRIRAKYQRKLYERMGKASRQLGAITNYDGIIASRAGGKGRDCMAFTTATLGGVTTVWYYDSHIAGMPGSLSHTGIPGGQLNHSQTTGAFPIGDAAAGEEKYLLTAGIGVSNANAAVAMLVDYLWEASGISATINTSQTVNSTALGRYSGTDAAGNMIINECAVAHGATAQNLTVTYTNSAGTAARSTGAVASVASIAVNRLNTYTGFGPFMPLAAGDVGVRSIETAQYSAANSAGSDHLAIVRPVLLMPTVAVNTFVERDSTVQIDGLTQLVKDSSERSACLRWLFLTTGTGTFTYSSLLRTCRG